MIDNDTRWLIQKACGDAPEVKLAPMDKGASGAKVWLAQFPLNKNQSSQYCVFKIHSYSKIQREHKNIQEVTTVLQKKSDDFQIYGPSKANKGLLRYQSFGSDFKAKSLREFLQTCKSIAIVEKTIKKLYQQRLSEWHPISSKPCIKKLKMKDAAHGWLTTMDLNAAAKEIGKESLEQSLKEWYLTNLVDMKKEIETIKNMEETFNFGTVHGDLHTQNVLRDNNGRLQLIDYAWASREKWKAVDFLMMECSLKFAVTPSNARLADLILLDASLDKSYGTPSKKYYKQLENLLYGHELAKVARAVHIVREEAIKRKAVNDIMQYKKGLILLTAGLANVRQVLNRVYLFHSLAYQLRFLKIVDGYSIKQR
ncbi:MAG: hypothetical protein AUH25_00170 [Thaumarchaeota archaeon 13_1_40CM_38_12]|nr:MAG: hypothetical protein AUH25_00170 [Thaumarchaeota archaeon 13_1_40CM_38_12]OLC35156.1 MAG: hypothetical protein AUH84_03690 [Thaumarchaeota archaeon 13_1_40CM_4_38_7]OLC94168.1 MAG: hypothetical protein AUI92_01345 [Thaumarchaeota archaeon 13_1_40CM_3_38_6]